MSLQSTHDDAESIKVKWLQDRLANIEELHAVRVRTVDGATLRWCRECQQDWPCPTVELARG